MINQCLPSGTHRELKLMEQLNKMMDSTMRLLILLRLNYLRRSILEMRRRRSLRLQPRRNINSQQHHRNNHRHDWTLVQLCRQMPKTESWKG